MADKNQSSGRDAADESKKDYPGYPHYPAGEDITRPGNSTGKADLDVEHMNATGTRAGLEQRAVPAGEPVNSDAAPDPDADVTPEDVAMLEAADQNRDMDDPDAEESLLDTTDEDGDPLNEPRATYGQTGADLDVPGSETDDGNEDIGEEDEENNYYSLGGDNKENLEEDPGGV